MQLPPCPFLCTTDREPLCTLRDCICLSKLNCRSYEAYINGEIDASGESTAYDNDEDQ